MTTITEGRRSARRAARVAASLAMLVAAAAAQAQTAPGTATPPVPATAPAAVKEPRAMQALESTGRYLRSLKSFSLRADTVTDEVLASGQKLQFGSTVDYRYVAPDRLRLQLRSDRQHRDLVYDGKTLTLWAPRMKLYATVAAPATTAELVQVADRDYGVSFPLADLFLWGTDKAAAEDVIEAMYVGPASVAGERCDHYAFRQADVDWQLWIRQGASPLPCRLVITTKSEPEQPQYTAQFKWDLAAKPQASSFRFTPPADARRIEIVRADAANASK
jgi:hypothetical protein